MKNLFLTGEIQVGKSTIIKRVLEGFQGSLGGFRTLYDISVDGKKGFVIEGLNPVFRGLRHPICRYSDEGYMIGLSDTFEDYGVKILRHSLEEKVDLVVMDELGVFESEAFNFQKLVFAVLDSPIPVLGVLKAKPSPFLDEIRNRQDVVIYSVTLENRNFLAGKVREFLNKLFGSTKGMNADVDFEMTRPVSF